MRGFGGAARPPPSTERRISMSKSKKKLSTASSAAPAPAARPSQQTAGNTVLNTNADHVSKQSHVIALLQSPMGSRIAALMKATGWQQHSVRGFLAGVVRKRSQLKLGSKKLDGTRVYQIAGGKSGSRRSKRQSS